MSEQTSLFEDEFPEVPEPRPVAGLRIVRQDAKPLGQAQRAFNRLVARVENLRAALIRETARLDGAMAFHVATLHPLDRKITGFRKDLVRKLALFLQEGKGLGKKQKEALHAVVARQLEAIAGSEGGLVDEDLQKIFTAMSGPGREEAEAEDLAEIKEQMSALFEEMGMEVDLSALQPGLDPREAVRIVAELRERIERAQAEAPEMGSEGPGVRAPRKKTKRQLAEEEREQQLAEARARNIGGIYKQLARALHPDLEPDPAQKAQKEALMKELTVAYKQNDLHTLLRLELEWIHREQGDSARLGDEKLAVYNEVLKEQVAALEEEHAMLERQPRYQALWRYAGSFGTLRGFDGERERERLEQMGRSIQESLARLGGPEARAELREIVHVYQARVRFRARMGPFAFD